ncbi:PREDICTED: uncharacterized protein C2orf78-like [Dipodomys ordii]|uniref:Uncharacterized protein C2orf78-like n=1 Tax=Dipodomys ordii TaxID=10020 RepID=A0A1S3F1F9_DIPOR|nr:PREDICTED: uncharacterized protein C2orf78-like [Dipodomys ordii]
MLGHSTLTLTQQSTLISSSTLNGQYTTCAHTRAIVSPYLSLSPSLVQGTRAPPMGPEEDSLPPSYWQGSQHCCCHPQKLGPLFSKQLGPCLQAHGSVSNIRSRPSTPQSDIGMDLEGVHPISGLALVVTLGIYYSESTEPVQDTNVLDNFCNPYVLGAANSGQLFLPMGSDATYITASAYNISRLQIPVFTSAWPLPSPLATSFHPLMGSAYLCQYSTTTMWAGQAAHSHISTSAASSSRIWEWDMLGHSTVTLTQQSTVISSSTLTSQYTTCAHARATVSPYPSLSPSLVQGTPASPMGPEEDIQSRPYWEGRQGCCCHPHTLGPLFSGEFGPCLQPHGSVSDMGSRASTPQSDIGKDLVVIHPINDLPPVCTLEMYYSETAEPTQDTNVPGDAHGPSMEASFPHIVSARHSRLDQGLQEDLMQLTVDTTTQPQNMGSVKGSLQMKNSIGSNSPSIQPGKNKHEVLELADEAPKAKVQRQNPEKHLEEQAVVCTLPRSDTGNLCRPSTKKRPKPPHSSISQTKTQGSQKNQQVRETNRKRIGTTKEPGNQVQTQKTSTTKERRKRNQPEPSQEALRKPRSHLAMHMMESVQVFHALGDKRGKKTGLPTSRALGQANASKDTRFSTETQSNLHSKSPLKFRVNKTKRSSENQCPSPSQSELLPPPGKVKLVPLPFLSPEKPRVRPASRRPQSLASRRPTGAYSTRPLPNTAQPVPVNAAQPATDNSCLMTTRPTISNSTLGAINKRPQSVLSSRPAPYETSSFTSRWNTTATKLSSLPKPPHQYLLQDFSLQPIPWRKSHVPGPVESDPISKELRPEREAMKRQAQQERGKAAKNTFVGKIPFFHQRQIDMEIAQYYGYAI